MPVQKFIEVEKLLALNIKAEEKEKKVIEHISNIVERIKKHAEDLEGNLSEPFFNIACNLEKAMDKLLEIKEVKCVENGGYSFAFLQKEKCLNIVQFRAYMSKNKTPGVFLMFKLNKAERIRKKGQVFLDKVVKNMVVFTKKEITSLPFHISYEPCNDILIVFRPVNKNDPCDEKEIARIRKTVEAFYFDKVEYHNIKMPTEVSYGIEFYDGKDESLLSQITVDATKSIINTMYEPDMKWMRVAFECKKTLESCINIDEEFTADMFGGYCEIGKSRSSRFVV